ncbi:MAG: cysteine desulfurase [Archangium gephyra]|uniref:Cysteine desulfurase n=1 Tax=Archangium gephyra TaxID=48 RepID=A0A2W5TYT2_9BACT|nr:MAG: cysteine desulfurase [Archangium gephyra]
MIYLDHNAGSPLRAEVVKLLSTAFEAGGNPSSVHQAGRAARRRLDAARESVARRLGCTPREIVFTGSGSEGAAIAVLGAFRARKDRSKNRVVTTAIEHPCVLGAVDQLEQEGAEVLRVAPGADGRVPLEALLEALTPTTAVCSVQWVNNETGVIQPAPELARACAQRGIVFHCDAVQAFGKLDASLREVPADLLSLSAHKLGGPAGVGVLYNRRGVNVAGVTPGHQENGRRGGTQSVAFAEAMALSLSLSIPDEKVGAVRDELEAKVRAALPDVQVNGTAARVGNTSNLWFPGVDGEALLIALDLEGICVSTGAACASGSLSPSHVLLAMGRTSTQAHSSLRFSLGSETTAAQLDHVVAALTRLVPANRT